MDKQSGDSEEEAVIIRRRRIRIRRGTKKQCLLTDARPHVTRELEAGVTTAPVGTNGVGAQLRATAVERRTLIDVYSSSNRNVQHHIIIIIIVIPAVSLVLKGKSYKVVSGRA